MIRADRFGNLETDGLDLPDPAAVRDGYGAGPNVADLVHPDDSGRVQVALTELASGDAVKAELGIRLPGPDGGWTWHQAVMVLADGHDVEIDIELRRRASEPAVPFHLHRRSSGPPNPDDVRRRVLTDLTSGITEDLAGPVQSLGDNLRFLQRALADLPIPDGGHDPRFTDWNIDTGGAIRDAVGALKDVERSLRSLRALASAPGTEATAVEINAIVEAAAGVCRNQLSGYRNFAVDLDPAAGRVMCVGPEIARMLLDALGVISRQSPDRRGPAGTVTLSTVRAPASVEIVVDVERGALAASPRLPSAWTEWQTVADKVVGEQIGGEAEVIQDRHRLRVVLSLPVPPDRLAPIYDLQPRLETRALVNGAV